MGNIIELSLSYFKLKTWLASLRVKKKLCCESVLRDIEKYLSDNGICVIDYTGKTYDAGMSVDVLCTEKSSKKIKAPYIKKMLKPVIIKDGKLICRGQVILAVNNMEGNNDTLL